MAVYGVACKKRCMRAHVWLEAVGAIARRGGVRHGQY